MKNSCIVVLGAIIFAICNGAPLNSNEEEARKFAEDASKQLYAFYDTIAAQTLGLDAEKLSSLELEAAELSTFFNTITKSDLMLGVVRNASLFAKTKFKDEELNYIFEKLKMSADVFILGGKRIFYLLSAMVNLESLAVKRDIKSYKNETVQLSYLPDIQNILATSSDPEEMKYYWNAWREKNVEWAMHSFFVVFNGIKDAASLMGISAYEFWMQDFNMTQMDAVMTQIEPFYRQLHAFLRHQLNKKYGDAIVDTKGLIPDHLFQQVLAQTWTDGSVIDENFPYKDLPAFDAILAKNNYDTLKLFKMADQFYESMGFKAVNESYWGTKLKMRKDEDEGDCKATIIAASPNVYMQYCHKMDFRTFLQAHGYMAQIHFALEKPDLPVYYFDSYNLEYAVGEAVILSASSTKYLAKVGIIAEPEFTEEVFMNRLMRLCIQTMLNIPVYYVHTKMMADLFSEKVELRGLNKHYWELMDKYVGVGPPSDHVHDIFDFPYTFYMELNENIQARKFNSEVLSYQFYKKLCSIAGQYPKVKLQNCEFSYSKCAGDALKKMIKLGSSKPIHEVLAAMLPDDPKLNAESLLEYFFPALSWLNAVNEQKKVNIGWTHSDKK